MKIFFISIFMLCQSIVFSQDSMKVSNSYSENIKRAEEFFKKKEFEASGKYYSLTFANNKDLGKVIDRYNAACSWVLANKIDSAFFQLNRIATKGNFRDLDKISSDKTFVSLHTDSRWSILIEQIKKNNKEFENKLTNGNVFDLDAPKQ